MNDEYNNSSDASILRELLKSFPEKDPPAQFTQQVMEAVHMERQSFWSRLMGRLTNPMTFTFQPMRLAGAFSVVVLAFALGHYWGGQQSTLSTENPNPALSASGYKDAETNFVLGRDLLQAGDPQAALPYLARAAQLDPESSRNALWEGVAHWQLGNLQAESASYKRALNLEPDNVSANIYLAHNLLNQGRYSDALEQYENVLRLAPQQYQLICNQALLFEQLGNSDQAIRHWQEYLGKTRTGKWAFRAVEHLNTLGDFSYRVHIVGAEKFILAGNDFDALENSGPVRGEFNEIVRLLQSEPQLTLHVVVYKEGEKLQAKREALAVRNALRNMAGDELAGRIKASWFGQAEKISHENGVVQINQSTRLIGLSERQVI